MEIISQCEFELPMPYVKKAITYTKGIMYLPTARDILDCNRDKVIRELREQPLEKMSHPLAAVQIEAMQIEVLSFLFSRCLTFEDGEKLDRNDFRSMAQINIQYLAGIKDEMEMHNARECGLMPETGGDAVPLA